LNGVAVLFDERQHLVHEVYSQLELSSTQQFACQNREERLDLACLSWSDPTIRDNTPPPSYGFWLSKLKIEEEDGVRIPKILRSLLALDKSVVFIDWGHNKKIETTRAELRVWIRQKVRKKGCRGCCGERRSREDCGGGERRWRHVDVSFATSTLVAVARRVKWPTTVAGSPGRGTTRPIPAPLRTSSSMTPSPHPRPLAARHTFSWRAVNDACMRVSTEALGRIELHAGLSTIAIDEVKYKMGHKYLTVVCSHANRQGRSDLLPQRREIDRPIALLAQTVVAPRPSPVLRAFAVVPHTGTEGLHGPPGHRSRHR
jgi:hypothetical protein